MDYRPRRNSLVGAIETLLVTSADARPRIASSSSRAWSSKRAGAVVDGRARARLGSWGMLRLLATPLVAAAFHASIQPLPAPLRTELTGPFWHAACPVRLSQLRVLTVSHWDFAGHVRRGQLVVNEDVAAPLARVFRRLYQLRFPIRHLSLADMYGPSRSRPADGDVSGSFHCRQAVPSPCSGGTGTGSWSEHAYGKAVDLNPVENPYVGCSRTRERRSVPYLDRSRLRKGMVTPAVVHAFRSIGWGWGGNWTGSTKDYMHFSASGH
jgi:D-alanyl-D-alanine carboxypeptidase